MARKVRQLYQCGHAVVGPLAPGYANGAHRLICKAGRLFAKTLTTAAVERGEPLELAVCQGYRDYV